MKMIKCKHQGNLGYMIKVEDEFNEFIDRYCMDILNDDGIQIGEIKGYKLKMDAIRDDLQKSNGRYGFLALDAISHLCSLVYQYLNENKVLSFGEPNIYFLNRFSFFPEYQTVDADQKGLELLQKKMGAIVYSFGSTELDDDFPEPPYENYYTEHEAMLKTTGWDYDETFSFYIKKTTSRPSLVLIK